jgi:four helix bundle protein
VIQFLCHARGSIFELETQVLIATKLGYMTTADGQRLSSKMTEAARILNGLLTSLGIANRKTIH